MHSQRGAQENPKAERCNKPKETNSGNADFFRVFNYRKDIGNKKKGFKEQVAEMRKAKGEKNI